MLQGNSAIIGPILRDLKKEESSLARYLAKEDSSTFRSFRIGQIFDQNYALILLSMLKGLFHEHEVAGTEDNIYNFGKC